jgi:hypothetical protein
MKTAIDTSSREYTEWMAAVWKANAERNKQLKAVQGVSILEKHNGILPDDIYELLS